VESRQSLKLASGVRFAHPLPLAAGAIGGAPRSERGGSRFEAWAASQFFTGIVLAVGIEPGWSWPTWARIIGAVF
jgi:hypothetical protein